MASRHETKNTKPDIHVGGDIDSLFPQVESDADYEVNFNNLPYLTRPIVEYFYKARPSVVIASDRGGRPFALSALYSWKKRFPGEYFPTLDRKIHFARVSGHSAEPRYVKKAVKFAMERAGLTAEYCRSKEAEGLPIGKVVLMDDWAIYGETLGTFLEAVGSLGVPCSSVAFVTMCGNKVDQWGVEHIVGDPNRRWGSVWNNISDYIGVRFPYDDGVTPVAKPTRLSVQSREDLRRSTDEYYREFTAALASGAMALDGSAQVS